MAEYLTQIVRQLQYTALLGNLDVDMPAPFRKFLDIFSVLNIDPTVILGRTAVPEITFRVIFFLIGCCLPMIINILLLVVSKKWYVVMWYWTLLVGFLLCFVGILGKFLPGTSTVNEQASENLAIIGGVMFIAAATIFGIKKLQEKYCPEEDEFDQPHNAPDEEGDGNSPSSPVSTAQKNRLKNMSISQLRELDQSGASASGNLNTTQGLENTERYEDAETRRERHYYSYMKRFHRKRALVHIFMTFIFIFSGLLLSGLISISAPGVETTTKDEFDSSTFRIIGFILLGLGGVSLIYMLLNTFRQGRIGAYKLVRFLEQNLLRILIVAVFLTFIPIVSYCIDTYMCTTYSCPIGRLFNPAANRPVGSWAKDASYFCDVCEFNTTLQPQCNNDVVRARCGGFEGKRLFADPEAVCNDEGYVYIVIASVVILLTFIAGVPLLFYTVTKDLAEEIMIQVNIIEEEDDNPVVAEEKNWQKKQAFCPVVAGSIYSPFTYKMRYYALIDLAQRFLFVIFLQAVAPFANFAVVLVLACHVIFFFGIVIVRPYAETTLQSFATMLNFANVVNSTLMVVLWAQDGADGLLEFAYVAIAVNAVISVIGGLILLILEFRAIRVKTEKYEAQEEEADKERLTNIDTSETVPDYDKEEAKADVEESAKERRRHNSDVTSALNTKTLGEMSNRFMIMGVVVCIAAALTVLSILREPESPFRVGSNILFLTTKNQLAGYKTWDNFTSNCCCMPGTATFDDFNVTERWVCANGKSTVRGRQGADGTDNGLLVRSLCNTTFNFGCVVTVNKVIDRAELSCSTEAETTLKNQGFTDTAKTLYF